MPGSINMRFLLSPASIAIMGASSDFTKLSGRPLRFLLERGYRGNIYPVNPKYNQIGNLKCYSSLAELPEVPDLAIIALPAEAAVQALAACGQNGVRSAVIFSAGFGETGPHGQRLEEEIRQISLTHNMAVCGPNCAGLLNLKDQVIATFNAAMEKARLLPGEMTFISQSGALGTYMFSAAQDAGVGFNYWVSTGNETVLGTADYISYFLEGENARAIMIYMEDARDGNALKECAFNALAKGKPLIILKVGSSEAGARAASSHTGALAGSDQVYGAVFKQAGIMRARSVEELFDLGIICTGGHWPTGRRVALLTISGGAGILMADKCEEVGLEIAALAPGTTEALRKALPPYASVDNPVDVTAELITRPELLKRAMEIVLKDPAVDSLIIFLGLQISTGLGLARDIAEMASAAKKPVVVNWMAPPPEALAVLRDNAIPVFPDPARGVKAVSELVKYSESRRRFLDRNRSAAQGNNTNLTGDINQAKSFLTQIRMKNRTTFTEKEAKNLLAEYGIPVPRGELAGDSREAVTIANKIGFPVVMKVNSGEIPHKTEASGVLTGLKNDQEVVQAYAKIVSNVRAYNPQAGIDGILIEEMVPKGTEIIVGVKQDPCFGPVLTFGLGGIFVEILKDIVFRPIPFDHQEAMQMLREIKGYPLLAGYRGQKKGDLEALAKVLERVGRLVQDFQQELAELEINPLLVMAEGEGVKALDALIVLR